MNIANNTFIVTGGGSGLVAAAARMIVGAGGYAVLAEVNPDAAGAVVAEPQKKSTLPASGLLVTTVRSASSTAYSDFGKGNERPGTRARSNRDPYSPAECCGRFHTVFGVMRMEETAPSRSSEPSPARPTTVISPSWILRIWAFPR